MSPRKTQNKPVLSNMRILLALYEEYGSSDFETDRKDATLIDEMQSTFKIRSGRNHVSTELLCSQAIKVLETNSKWKSRIDIGRQRKVPVDYYATSYLMDAAVIAAIIMVLKTEVRVSRNTRGGWKFELNKGAISDPLLKDLIDLARKFVTWFKNDK